MKRTLLYHPLSSYSWKVLVALYEANVEFDRDELTFGDENAVKRLNDVWPFNRFPVLKEDDRVIAESSIIIEHVAPQLVTSLDARAWDRFFDTYVHNPMQKLVNDKMRPADKKDSIGVAEARKYIRTSWDWIEKKMTGDWMAGAFSVADCSAAPALWYGNKVEPIGDHPKVSAYLARLEKRPSFARALEEAKPYLHMFPGA